MEIILDATVKFTIEELGVVIKLLGNSSRSSYEALRMTSDEMNVLQDMYNALVTAIGRQDERS